jgi:hypothetical protein
VKTGRATSRKVARGGRPRKFDEPRRPVTVTLPERTLSQLRAAEPDLARAIVKVSDSFVSDGKRGGRPVEVVPVTRDAAIILVRPSRCLRQIRCLRLAEVAPGRHLLTLVSGTPVESLEVALIDLLESLPPEERYERSILQELRRLLTNRRREHGITKFEMLYIRPRATPAPG